MKLLDMVLSLFKPSKQLWFVETEFSKHGAKYYPYGPKSNSHKGTAVSNQYNQATFECNKGVPPSLETIFNNIRRGFPNASNFRILEMRRLY